MSRPNLQSRPDGRSFDDHRTTALIPLIGSEWTGTPGGWASEEYGWPRCDINADVARPLTAILLNLALFLAFVQAPFDHTHQHQSTQRHPGPLLHLHFKSFHAPGRGTVLQAPDPDDDAQFQNWFAVTHHDQGTGPAVLTEHLSLSAAECIGWVAGPLPEMGPDPPRLSAKNPRAPPV
jgi:hypothetical protein